MSKRQDDKWVVRHILVALDTSHHSLAALQAAVELAANLGAELEGLFVEDVNLLRAAEAPMAREVRYPFTAAVRLDQARMERQLRVQATQARQALEAASQQRQVKWSFHVARGKVAPKVLEASLGVDLLILGRVSRPLVRRVRLGSTARAAAEGAPCSVLLMRHEVGIRPPVMVTYDGSPTARKALTIASQLARNNAGYLAVLDLADTAEEEHRLQAETASWLRKQGLLIRHRRLTGTGAATLIQAMRAEGCGLLVLSETCLSLGALQTLLDKTDCPVLLVR